MLCSERCVQRGGNINYNKVRQGLHVVPPAGGIFYSNVRFDSATFQPLTGQRIIKGKMNESLIVVRVNCEYNSTRLPTIIAASRYFFFLIFQLLTVSLLLAHIIRPSLLLAAEAYTTNLIGSFDESFAGIYTSTFNTYCSNDGAGAFTYMQAVERCAAMSTTGEWGIAAIPNRIIAITVRNQRNAMAGGVWGQTWLGGSDRLVEGAWVWEAGRLKGMQFSIVSACIQTFLQMPGTTNIFGFPDVDCGWASGEPNNLNGEDCLEYSAGAGQETRFNDISCAKVYPCYACERSACVYGLDCSEIGTISMSGTGFFPNCHCNCKPGFNGTKCQYIVVNYTTYTSQYDYVCDGSPFTYASAKQLCAGRGDGGGWQLATAPTSHAIARLSETNRPYKAGWMAGTDAAEQGVWRWDAGRLSGKQFSQGSTCLEYVYNPHGNVKTVFNNTQCGWLAGEPSGSSPTGQEDCLAFGSNAAANNLNDVHCTAAAATCVMCERSACQWGTDCHAPTTLEMTGDYFPNCHCTCKPGYEGKYCQIAQTNTSLYENQYEWICDSAMNATRDVAAAACAARGNGWALATFPTKGLMNAIYPLMSPFATTWVAGNETSAEGRWQWAYGRLSTFSFANVAQCLTYDYRPVGAYHDQFTECLWHSGEPNGTTAENCAEIRYDTTPYNFADERCSAVNECYMCERSPCRINIDCSQEATAGMAGTSYPNCVCTCKPGYTGSKCEITTVVHPLYTSEYVMTCGGAISYEEAKAGCAARNSGANATDRGWMLATFPTTAALDAFSKQIRPLVPVWLGATDAAVEGQWRWDGGGRLSGKQFSSGSTCQTYTYRPFNSSSATTLLSQCAWAAGAPDGGPAENCGAIMPTATNGLLGDYGCTAASGIGCYVCERSLCVLGADCSIGGTQRVEGGYFPHCTCVCKPGYSGPYCTILTYNYTAYVSEYSLTCEARTTWFEAQSNCSARGSGWALATFPTTAASAAFLPLVNPMVTAGAVWLGGSDGAAEGAWRWTHGRHQGKLAAQGSVCSSYVYSPLGPILQTYSECAWGPAEPNGGATDNCLSFRVSTPSLSWNDAPCGSTYADTCYSCERSPCQLGADCALHTTLSVEGSYFPYCSCVCREGYTGDRCEIALVDHKATYRSEYQLVCSSPALNSAGAAAACRAGGFVGGNGWDLATFPSRASLDAVIRLYDRRFAFQSMWMAASDQSAETKWLWTAGRLAGLQFSAGSACSGYGYWPLDSGGLSFNGCSWASGEPGTSSADNCASLACLDGNCTVDASCTASTVACYACERSPCRLGTDCALLATAEMVGDYYPNCTCACKPGYGGARCDITMFNYTTHSSEYLLTCAEAKVNQQGAEARCRQRGAGWSLATFPTQAGLDAFAVHFAPSMPAWIGGARSAASSLGAGGWWWTSGRLANNKTFTSASSVCTGMQYRPTGTVLGVYGECLWDGSQPSAGGGDCMAFPQVADSSRAVDAYANADCADEYHCVACERSQCHLGTDCHAPTTLNMTGDFFPNCTCVCKPGYEGKYCEIAIVQHPLSTSKYTVACQQSAVTFAEAQTACRARNPPLVAGVSKGYEWDIAAFPSRESVAAFSPLVSPFSATWVGASDASKEGSWRWSAGRMADIAFSQGRSCLPQYYNTFGWAFNTYPAASSCSWAAGAPSTSNTANCAQLTTANLTAFTMGDVSCTAAVQNCYACEVSLCNMTTDCNANTTLRMDGSSFYPNCVCVCKQGYEGERCERANLTMASSLASPAPPASAATSVGYYSSQQEVVCAADATNRSGAASICSGRGAEWYLASLPLATALGNASLLLVGMRFNQPSAFPWVGATDAAESAVVGSGEGVWRWASGGGRLDNAQFSLGSSCIRIALVMFGGGAPAIFSHCPWGSSYPTTSATSNCAVMASATTMMDASCTSPARSCALCERSPCKMGLDCYGPNTRNMTGAFFPSCACNCVEGAWGSKCQWPLVVDHDYSGGASGGLYQSEYVVLQTVPSTAPTAVSSRSFSTAATSSAVLPSAVTYSEASQSSVCASVLGGAEWTMGTVPSATAMAQLRARMSGVVGPMWVAAKGLPYVPSVPQQRTWAWDAGRLSQRTFYRMSIVNTNGTATAGTTTCDRVAFVRSDGRNADYIGHCPWAAGSPIPSSAPSQQQCVSSIVPTVATEVGLQLSDALPCATRLTAVVCERSLCQLGIDCDAAHTSSIVNSNGTAGSAAYFPNCRCVCKPGTWGPKCQYPRASSTDSMTTTVTVTSSLPIPKTRSQTATLLVITMSTSLSHTIRGRGGAGWTMSKTGGGVGDGFTPTLTTGGRAGGSYTMSKTGGGVGDGFTPTRTIGGRAGGSYTLSKTDGDENGPSSTVSVGGRGGAGWTRSKTGGGVGDGFTPTLTTGGRAGGSYSTSKTGGLEGITSSLTAGGRGGADRSSMTRTGGLNGDGLGLTQSLTIAHTYIVNFSSYDNDPPKNEVEDNQTMFDDLLLLAAPVSSPLYRVKSGPCSERLGRYMFRHFGLVTPLVGTSWSYGDAIWFNILFGGVILAFGTGTLVLVVIYVKTLMVAAELKKGKFGGFTSNNNQKPTGGLVGFILLFKTWASFPRYPATAIQGFIFLSQTSAFGAGISLGGDLVTDGGAVIAAMVVLAAPIVMVVIVRFIAPKRVVEVASALDDKLSVVGANGEVVPERKGPKLLCALVSPRDPALSLGPLTGDLRLTSHIAPAIPGMLGVFVLVGAIAGSFAAGDEECGRIPLATGVMVAIYAAFVGVVRPYLGYTHNILEFSMSASVAGLLIGWFTVHDGFDSQTGRLSWYEETLFVGLTVLGNSRYPFILARALDVVLPAVGAIVWGDPPEGEDAEAPTIFGAKKKQRGKAADGSDGGELRGAGLGVGGAMETAGAALLMPDELFGEEDGDGEEELDIFPEETGNDYEYEDEFSAAAASASAPDADGYGQGQAADGSGGGYYYDPNTGEYVEYPPYGGGYEAADGSGGDFELDLGGDGGNGDDYYGFSPSGTYSNTNNNAPYSSGYGRGGGGRGADIHSRPANNNNTFGIDDSDDDLLGTPPSRAAPSPFLNQQRDAEHANQKPFGGLLRGAAAFVSSASGAFNSATGALTSATGAVASATGALGSKMRGAANVIGNGITAGIGVGGNGDSPPRRKGTNHVNFSGGAHWDPYTSNYSGAGVDADVVAGEGSADRAASDFYSYGDNSSYYSTAPKATAGRRKGNASANAGGQYGSSSAPSAADYYYGTGGYADDDGAYGVGADSGADSGAPDLSFEFDDDDL